MERLPPPESPEEFESLCLDLWAEVWGHNSRAQKNGRSGQRQAGVDVYGSCSAGWAGVQCKQKDGLLRLKVSVRELEAEVEAARGFRPPLCTFVLATTGPRDGKIQARARELCATTPFTVEVWGWEEIWCEITRRPALLERLLPIYWPLTTRRGLQKVSPSRLSHTTDRLFGREVDLARLVALWDDRKIRIITLVAFGGVGKTSLAAKFAADLSERGYSGADYFDWSFYSQGSRDQSSASADSFLDAALRFWGDAATADSVRGAWDKGAKLAEILGSRRALLVLDGLEPLQHPPGPLTGELKDLGLQALLKGLAAKNAGLCIVTTREKVADLGRWPGALEWTLESLSLASGVALLESLGVNGSPRALADAVAEVRGHALTLSLLGRYLAAAHRGDVSQRDLVGFEEADREIRGGHAFRVIAAYARWFETAGDRGQRDLAALQLLGLFDRPANMESLRVLRASPPIAGLTEALVGHSDAQWSLSLDRLAQCHLILTNNLSEVDAHPLIREYFADLLRTHHPVAWREAHGRIFDCLKKGERTPASLQGLQPLYQAVFHGCQAGRYEEASQVYRERIVRGKQFFSTSKLGAFGAGLGTIACFFAARWGRVTPTLPPADQAWLLNQAAYHLLALGRLQEAVEPMRTAVAAVIQLQDWSNASRYAANLSDLELALGRVPAAIAAAEAAKAFADRSGGPYEPTVRRSTLADAYHQAGRKAEALALLEEAETKQIAAGSLPPLLYGIAGFRYCDVLLSSAEREAGKGNCGHDPRLIEDCIQVEARAQQTVAWANQRLGLLAIALSHLSLIRARLYRALLESEAARPLVTERDVDSVVTGLRNAGQLGYLPSGLLTRAWFRLVQGNEEGTRLDLAEAHDIAERSAMKLHLADVALYRARLFRDRNELTKARRLVEECGYDRRLAELSDLEVALP